MNTEMTEAMKLKKFHAYQARLVKLWTEAGMDVPNEYPGNLVHYAMCEVIDNTESWELPARFIGFDTRRPALILKSLYNVHRNDEYNYATQGYATSDERDAHDEMAEYAVTVICHHCECLNYINV